MLERENFMGTLPILQRNTRQPALLGNEDLPANYMGDYSLLGLVVKRLDAALRVLRDRKFEVRKKLDGFEIIVDGAGRMSEIVNLLQQNGIDFALADIVDQVYQG